MKISKKGPSMDVFKSAGAKGKATIPTASSKTDGLRLKRLEHEHAQKAAGIWGDMSVGTVTREGQIFVYSWKGSARASLSEMATKKPKEISPADHEAFLKWLKSGRFEGFVQAFAAWNVSAEEAERIKVELMAKHRTDGMTIINQI
jgi:hypothetical protein